MSDHAKLAPSGASEWITKNKCMIPYVVAPDVHPPKGPAAHFGTAMHHALEIACEDSEWRRRIEQGDLRRQRVSLVRGHLKITDHKVPDAVWHQSLYVRAMRDSLLTSLAAHDKLCSLHAECEVDVLYERRVYPLAGADDVLYGTSDITIICHTCRELIIADYKSGVHPVIAKGNKQLLTYLSGALRLVPWTPDSMYLAIIAPRMIGRPVLDVESVSQDDIAEHRDSMQSAVTRWAALTQAASRGETPAKQIALIGGHAVPSIDQCRWCALVRDCGWSIYMRAFGGEAESTKH